MTTIILDIILIVAVIILNICIIKTYKDINKEFTSIYMRVWELEKLNYKNKEE